MDINALVTQYISPQPRWDDATKSFVTASNNLPEEFLNAVKLRSKISGANLPTGIETLSESNEEEVKDQRLMAPNFMGLEGVSVSLQDINIPKMPIDLSKVGATGSGDFIGNVINLGFETLGFGQPFKGLSSAKKDLDAINVDLITVLLAGKAKTGLDERKEIRRLLPDISAFIGGDETAAGKIKSTIAFIDKKLETEILGLNQLFKSKGDFSSAAQRVLRLKQLKAGYTQFQDAYNLSKRGGQTRPPLSNFLKKG